MTETHLPGCHRKPVWSLRLTVLYGTKQRVVSLAGSGHFTMTELCRDFGVSRKTGHKYEVERWLQPACHGRGGRSPPLLKGAFRAAE